MAIMALPEDDSPENRLFALLDQLKLWACKVSSFVCVLSLCV